MIEAHSLTKRYGEKTAVDDLTFSVHPGLVTGFLGPNGAGKSTTMRLVLGLDAPSSGEVTVNGSRYRDLKAPLFEVGALLEARAVHTGRSARNHLLALARIGDGETIVVDRTVTERVDWEVELAAVIDRPMTRVPAAELPDPQALGLRTRVNGETVQDSNTAEMVFGVAELLSFCSRSFTLEPGDVVLTGTPWGCGEFMTPPRSLQHSDVVEIDGIGTLRNPVADLGS